MILCSHFVVPFGIPTVCIFQHSPASCSYYRPFNSFLRLQNWASFNTLVKISAIRLWVSTYFIDTDPDFTDDLKWWYFNAMCLILSLILGVFTRSVHPLLSSNMVKCIVGASSSEGAVFLISFNNYINGSKSLSDCDSAMHSPSLVNISVWSLLHHIIGQLA